MKIGAVLTSQYTGYKYLLEYAEPPAPAFDCVNFFNKTWVCFADEVSEFTGVQIEEDSSVYSASCQNDAPWHLATVSGAGDKRFYYDFPQPDTAVYVLDTWMDIGHAEFENRAVRGKAFIEGNSHPHATHVGGLVGGKTYGVNKNAKIISVQVLDDNSRGAWSVLLKGLEWVSAQRAKGIINISISGAPSNIVDNVINTMIAHGWKIVVASGNNGRDACAYSPAKSKAVTVGATDSSNRWAQFSNYGACVNLVAPGDSVLSAYPNNRLAYMSGTSMAAPIVAGIWSANPSWGSGQLLKVARRNIVVGIPRNTVNLLSHYPTRQRCINMRLQ